MITPPKVKNQTSKPPYNIVLQEVFSDKATCFYCFETNRYLLYW